VFKILLLIYVDRNHHQRKIAGVQIETELFDLLPSMLVLVLIDRFVDKSLPLYTNVSKQLHVQCTKTITLASASCLIRVKRLQVDLVFVCKII